MADFKETKTILKELESLFTREDIEHEIEDANKTLREIEQQTNLLVELSQARIKRKHMPS
jgi:hypothetical protein